MTIKAEEDIILKKEVSAMEPVTNNRAIKYRIFPTKEQQVLLAQTFGCVRKVYNMGLELQQGLHESGFSSMTRVDLNNYCNRVWKTEFSFLRDVDKFALTNALYALERSYTNFFEKRAAYPKFKSRKVHQSYTTNMTNKNIAIRCGKQGAVKLPKLGWVSASIYREPKADWVIKSATVSKTATGKYYASILFAYQEEIPEVVLDLENAIGLDYSSPEFYVDSNGQTPGMPHYLRKAEQRLAKAQRRLSHMTQGSSNYEKQRLVVARLHEHIANQRKNFCHTESRKIANSYDIVCVEDLDLRAQAQSLNFGKAVADNGFGMFRTFLKYKLEEQGKLLIKVDKWFPSTKTCNHCGGYNPDVKLGQMVWTCPCCGRTIQRDWNAALNIRDEGLRMLSVA